MQQIPLNQQYSQYADAKIELNQSFKRIKVGFSVKDNKFDKLIEHIAPVEPQKKRRSAKQVIKAVKIKINIIQETKRKDSKQRHTNK